MAGRTGGFSQRTSGFAAEWGENTGKTGWTPRWNVEQAVSATVAWTKVWQRGGNLAEEMRREAAAYEKGEWI